MDLYADNILDHSKHPRHSGALERATVMHGEKNLSCGDQLMLHMGIEDDVMREIAWTGDGCAINQAGMSILSEELIGKTIDDAAKLDAEAIKKLLGVPVGTRRLKCALLCLHTLKNALHVYRSEPRQSWQETVGND